MSHVSKGFSWKSIEEKPANWETIRSLIQDAYDPKEDIPDRFWENALVYKVFLSIFPELKEWIVLDEDDGETRNKTMKKSKKPVSRKNEIQQRVEEELIRKEIQNIRIDVKTLQPLKTKQDMQISFLLTMIVWNYILFKKRQCSPVTHLDAIISFHRLYEVEKSKISRQDFLTSLEGIQERLRGIVNEAMYATLFQHPILLVDSTSQRRSFAKKLYPEQRLILDQIEEAVVHDRPLLLGNQMPTGTGKTFLAVPLAKKISKLKLKKTILFTCSNELVNKDVSSTALLADDLHLWLAKLVLPEKSQKPLVLLRPHKRCFPAKWKDVYKKEDAKKIGSVQDQWTFYTKATGKQPDLIVADFEATLDILKEADVLGNPFIAYIDEFVSDDTSNQLVTKICSHLPKQTVLLSSILPQFEHLPSIVSHFCHKYKTTKEECLHRVATADVNISCAIIDSSGYLRLPHHHVETREDAVQLHDEILVNPRIRRCYPAKHVYHWAKSVEDVLAPYQLRFEDRFPDIGTITNTRVIDYAIELLAFLTSHVEYIDDFKKYRPKICEAPDAHKIFTEQAGFYEGKTLFITQDIFKKIDSMTENLFDDSLKWNDIVSESKKLFLQRDARIQRLEKAKMTRLEKDRMMSSINDEVKRIVLPAPYVVNSREHFARFHRGVSCPIRPRSAIDLPDYVAEAFSDDVNLMLASGIGIYDRTHMTEYQRNIVMGIYEKLAFLCSGKDIVFGTNLPGLTNIFIDSSFAMQESIPTLYQLMGRVGRMGRSYHANIILNSEDAVRKVLSLETNMDHTSMNSMDQMFTLMVSLK